MVQRITYPSQVHQQLVGEVAAETVVAPGSAAQCSGSGETVGGAAAASGAGRLVDDQPGHRAVQGRILYMFRSIGVDSHTVALPFIIQVDQGHIDRIFKAPFIGDDIDHRAHLFPVQIITPARFGTPYRQYTGIFRNSGKTDDFGNLGRAQAHHFPADGTAGFREQSFADDIYLFGIIHIVSTCCPESFQEFFKLLCRDISGLFAQADQTIIEASAQDDVCSSLLDIRIAVYDALDIALAHPVGRFSAGISCLDHAHAAGGYDDIRHLHQLIAVFHGNLVHFQDQIFWETQFL